MSNYFKSNLFFLRNKNDITQAYVGLHVGKKANTIGYWEKGIHEPNISELEKICQLFDISSEKMLYEDLSKGNLNEKLKDKKNEEKGNLKGNLMGNLNEEKRVFHINLKDFENTLESSLNEDQEPYITAQDKYEQLAAKVAKIEAFISKLSKEMEQRSIPKGKRTPKT